MDDQDVKQPFLRLYEPHEGRWLNVPMEFVHDDDVEDEKDADEAAES